MKSQVKNSICLFLVAVTTTVAIFPAVAESITHNFRGIITSVSGMPFGLNVNIGDPVTGSITYDPTLAPNSSSSTAAGYIQNVPNRISVVIGNTTVTHSSAVSLQVINNNPNGSSNICGYFEGPLDNINGFGPWGGDLLVDGEARSGYIGFSLSDYTEQAVDSTALPTFLDFLSFSDRIGCFYVSGNSETQRIEFSIDPPVLAVKVDIKPGSFPNAINPKNRGVISVAILTTDEFDNVESFDASSVDPDTVLFGPTGTEAAPVHYAWEDVDGDGDIDMILHFKTQDTGIACEDTSAILTGETSDEEAIEGIDSIVTVGCK